MMALSIELSSDCLASPLPCDQIAIGSMMLWPNDASARELAARSAMIAWKLENADHLERNSLVQLAREAAAAMPLQDVRKLTAQENGGPYVMGSIAGDVLSLTISRVAVGAHGASMKRIFQEVAESWVEKCWPIDPKTIENEVWKSYRCVAHFWAAYWHCLKEHQDKSQFPCPLVHLPRFLGIAEAFRASGEATKTKQSPRTILLPNEPVRLPDRCKIPALELRF